MFFELAQVQKIQSGVRNLLQAKQTLDRKCLQSFSSNTKKISSSLANTLQAVLADSQQCLAMVKQLQDEVEMGYFVPTTLNLDQLVYDSSKLPDWFEFVFNKEYEKQKKNLDGMCKKTYKMQALPEVRFVLEKEVQGFRLLVERFEILTHKEKHELNIMGEAEILSAKCKCSKEKYKNFCKTVANKIVTFLQQSIAKSMNFSNSMNTIGQSFSNSFNVKLQPQQFQRAQLTNKFRQNISPYETQTSFNRQKMMRSVDLQNRTVYGRLNNDLNRTNNQWGGYVPKYADRTVYDFYHHHR